MSLFSLFMFNNMRSPFKNKNFHRPSNSFSINPFDIYEDENEDDIDYNNYSFTNKNNALMNFQDSRNQDMKYEKKFINDFYTKRNKIVEYNNIKKRTQMEYENMEKKLNQEAEITKQRYLSNLINDYKKLKIKKKSLDLNISELDMKKKNLEKINQKKREEKETRRKMREKAYINNLEKESQNKLLKYKKDKELEKLKKEKEFAIKKEEFKNKNELEMNNLKINYEISKKLCNFFDNYPIDK